jgi:ABC-2 type transport system permease protein
MRAAPGSFLWLLWHDIRINWRMLGELFSGWPGWLRWLLAISVFGLLHMLALGVLWLAQRNPELIGSDSSAIAAGGVFFWTAAQGLLGASRALYQRGELELLLSSPIAVWKPVAARAASVAASAFGSLAPFALPLANAGAFVHGPHWLAIYPVGVGLALMGTAIGFMIVVGLFYLVGPRRTRMVANVVAAVLAGAFVLGLQVVAILPDTIAAYVGGVFHELWGLGVDIGLEAALRAVVCGETVPVTAFLAASIGAFLLALQVSSGAFVRAAAVAAGSASGSSSRGGARFREGPSAALRIKEHRLLSRDPNLFAQLGLQIVYTLPLAVLLLRNPTEIPPAIAIAPLVVVLAAQLSASLAWLTVSGEDATELINTAPVEGTRMAVAKLSAIATPIVAILFLPMLALAMIDEGAALKAGAFAVLAGISTALLNFWHPMPGNRRGLLRRHHQSKLVAIAEHLIALLWACAMVLALIGSLIALIPIALVCLVLMLFRWKRSTRPHREVLATA